MNGERVDTAGQRVPR